MRSLCLTAALILAVSCAETVQTQVPEAACGDGVCSAADGEHCESCPLDCGDCGGCGDHACEAGLESCDECSSDCGACDTCGDGQCAAAAGEDCETCQADCGVCAGCGDATCDPAAGESCASCVQDCGVCNPCGDGTCDPEEGETCSTCTTDCGPCDTCGNGECEPEKESCETCPADCGVCARGGCIQGNFKAYWGNLHAHTHYSDGAQTPREAFAHARKEGLDFQWITDHREMLTATEWANCKAQADQEHVPGTFVTGCGYEMNIFAPTGERRGHINALFTGTLMKKPEGLTALYEALAGCSPCVGQWNHPPWPGDFVDYQYHPKGADAMRLMELSGGSPWEKKWNAYFLALRNGWTVSPAANEDNHSTNWGSSPRATGIWVTELSRLAIRQAVRGRRTFAAFDDTAWIKMMADDVCWMGSVLKGLGQTTLTVEARDRQPGDKFQKIELFGPDGLVLATKSCGGTNPCKVTFTRKVQAKTFFVAKATQADGGVLVSAPIWFEP